MSDWLKKNSAIVVLISVLTHCLAGCCFSHHLHGTLGEEVFSDAGFGERICCGHNSGKSYSGEPSDCQKNTSPDCGRNTTPCFLTMGRNAAGNLNFVASFCTILPFSVEIFRYDLAYGSLEPSVFLKIPLLPLYLKNQNLLI
ncbi:MAG: hypothetical protein LBQ54_04885 [Planctomycetaceae bacterium]|jgi:hypothetical protein|nr:hypothetical protein [Planctomycetaceae bacterium]